MPRGGARKGTPGTGYENRTDLATNYDNTQSAGAGGVSPSSAPAPARFPTPSDTPNLLDDTASPDEPVTAGLPIGAGPGPTRDTRADETLALKRYLPLLSVYLDRPDTPDSVKMLYRYIRGA